MPDSCCPVCGASSPRLVETHFDPLEKQTYQILHCPGCSLEYAWPFKQASTTWYQRSGLQDYVAARPGQSWIRHRIFFGFAVPGKRVLDVGCGNGKFVQDLLVHGYEAEGVDFDDAVIAHARAGGVLNVQAVDYRERLRQGSGPVYDIVSAIEVIEHVDDLSGFARFLAGSITPGGYLYLTTPNRRRPLFYFREDMDWPPHHLTRWDIDCLSSFLARHGLRLIKSETSFLPLQHFFTMLFYPLMKGRLIDSLNRWFRGTCESRGIPPATSLSSSADPSGALMSRLKILKIGRMVSFGLGVFEKMLFVVTLPITSLFWLYYQCTRKGAGVFIAALYQKEKA